MGYLLILAVLIMVILVTISIVYMIKNHLLLNELEDHFEKRRNPPPPKK